MVQCSLLLWNTTYESFFDLCDDVASLTFPVLSYPEKVKSVKLEKEPMLEGKLVGSWGSLGQVDLDVKTKDMLLQQD